MLTPISGAYGSEPSLVRGDVSLREEGVNANRKRINTPVHAQAKALSSKAPGNKASVGMKNFSAFFIHLICQIFSSPKNLIFLFYF